MTQPRADIEVRRFTLDRLDDYRSMRLAALADSPFAFGSTLEREREFDDARWLERLSGKDSVLLYALVDGELAGIGGGLRPGIRHDDLFAHPHSAWLISMWTQPSMRGRGVGEAVVRHVIEWARVEGYPELRLWVTEGNAPAERLYARLGFQRTGETQPVGADPADARIEVGMALDLSA